MAIYYHRQADYAARPRAPRRRGHLPAHRDDRPGQATLFEDERATARKRAMQHPCPVCHAPNGKACTRTPRFGEGVKPVELGYMCHAERHALVDDDQVDTDSP